ncbi:calcium ATPase [Gigaspora margarita]|uniref:Calcium ATPase n=1 Tax=Gigaspora margarita TaxID=4874 RepID=A0A8H3XHM1_GIGMA|nr:calcium ATPase [Gigaspora margarita]
MEDDSDPFETPQENNVKSQKQSDLLPHDPSRSFKSISECSSPLSETRVNASISDITQLKLNKSSEDEEEYMIELKLNKGNNMRCYTYDEEVPELPSDLVINEESSTSGSKNRGLSSDQALEKLIKVTNDILAEHDSPLQTNKVLYEFLIRPDTILALVSVVILVAFYIYGFIINNPYQYRLNTILFEALVIFAFLAFNGFLYIREKKLISLEINERTKNIINQLKQSGLNTIQDIKIPFVPSLTVAKVVRDGFVRNFPATLLVEGDIVEMLYGDVAPCKMNLISNNIPKEFSTKQLEVSQVFKPSFFDGMSSKDLWEQHIKNKGRYQFVLLETPWENCLRAVFKQKRPATIIAKQAEVLECFFLYRWIFVILGCAFVINLIRYISIEVIGNYHYDQAFEILLVLPIYSIIPIIPLAFPILWIITRSFANATLLVLFEALQTSKTEYEEYDEMDEFDADAPPPTKNVQIDRAAVWNKFKHLFIARDGELLYRSINLFESLGSATVICSLDREGTISSPFASVDQILFPNEEEDITVLDIAEDPSTSFRVKFEDQDWDQHLSRLKPLGLNLLLNTNCGVLQGRKRADQHRKNSSFQINAKINPARQSCLCRLGKEIGFTDDALQSFKKRKEIFVNSPCHPSLKERMAKDQWEVPRSCQLLSDGNLEMILDNCSDYWNGQGLQSMSEVIENKIYDFYQNAIINDMQCIAYAYRPINVVNGNKIPFLNPTSSDSGDTYIVLPSPPEAEFITDPEDDDLSRSQLIRLHRLKHGLLEANLHDFSFDQDNVTSQDIDSFYQEVIQGQIFLAMATLCHQPKPDVCNFIEDLRLAGIRFVYFSPTGERESKAYAERLGLETDWNTCILLSSPGDENSFADGYLESHDIKARLPRGIINIRDHLMETDDIPLQVSLFSECTPDTTKEMIRIFQEYGEVVCCIGSALNAFNTHNFAVADVSVAIEPMYTRERRSPMALGAALTTLPCGLFMYNDTSLYALTDIIRESRRLINGLRMGVSFLCGTYLSISLLFLLSHVLCLPPIFAGYQILWVTCIISPMLAFSFLFSPHVADTMTTMTVKNIDHLPDLKRFIFYFILRFSLPILMSLCMFITYLYYSGEILLFGSFGNDGWLRWSYKQQWVLIYAQNCTLVAFVWSLVWISCTFVNRTLPLHKFNPLSNRVWIYAFIASIILQAIFTAISLLLGPTILLFKVPYYIYLIVLLAPIIIFIPVQELVKMHDKNEYDRFQKRSKLLFNTKLGMHSPV